MRIIIVDDEQPSINLSKLMMTKNKYLEVVGAYTNPIEALKEIERLMPEAVFIDIEMPYMNGIELASKVNSLNEDIQIVFVTAYKQYAVEAFDVNAVHYILKPITLESLEIVIKRLVKNRKNKQFKPMSQMATKDINSREMDNKLISFGEFSILGKDKEKIQWPTAKSKELFGYFVINKGREIDKWELCEILFPNATSKSAEHSLHSTISRAKLALKNKGIIDIISCVKGKYIFDLSKFSCDLWDWEEFINNNQTVTSDNIYDYEDIIKLYKGDLFQGEDYVWSLSYKENLYKEYLATIQKIASYFINNENYEKAKEYLESYINLEPYNEDVVELLIRVYYFIGRRFEMMELYKNTQELLDKELGVEPRESLSSTYFELIGKL